MNKKGFISFTGLFLLVLFCAVGLAMVNGNLNKQEITTQIDSAMDDVPVNLMNNFEYKEGNTVGGILTNIIYKVIDVTVYVYVNIAKLATRIAVEHPEVNFMLIIRLLMWFLVLIVLVPLIKLFVILFVIIHDTIKHLKEKKELRRLKDAQRKA